MVRFLRHGRAVFDTRRTLGPHRWPHHDLFFVHQGSVSLEMGEMKRRLDLGKGQGVLIWPGTQFRGNVVSKQAEASIQHFAVERGEEAPFDQLLKQRDGWSEQGVPAGEELERDIVRALEMARSGDVSSRVEIMRRSILAMILIGGNFLGAPGMVPKPRIDSKKLENWLAPRLANNPGVEDLATVVGLSPSRFRAIFKEEQGRTAGEFLRSYRERESRRLLTETNRSLKEIAAALGYADAVVFHRAFVARVGETPARYRKLHMILG